VEFILFTLVLANQVRKAKLYIQVISSLINLRQFKICVILLLCAGILNAQNQTKKWLFGYGAGLDFMTSPPTILAPHSMNSVEGCGSTADAFGNLLFYTDGITVWNKNHQIMPNGTGLMGHQSATQSGLIIKQPGNTNLYFIFTVDELGGNNGLRYSIVDISLNGGLGGVTSKNVLLYTPTTEKLAAVWHCNGTDVWILSHEWNSNSFVAYLLTSFGLNSNPVMSSIGTSHTGGSASAAGQMKVSPNGRKLGLVATGLSLLEMFDFNSASGIVSNAEKIDSTLNFAFGLEFSNDGTKLYTRSVMPAYVNGDAAFASLYQFNLCAGNVNAIRASKTLLLEPAPMMMALQLAPDGKIYIARGNHQVVGVINDPNAIGLACNFVLTGQQVATVVGKRSVYTFPGFISGYFKQSYISPFTYTTNCQQVIFDAKASLFTNPGNCSARYAMTSMAWNFGDPASGASNISTASNPVHVFSAPGIYTVQLVRVFPCNPDTLRQVVTISAPSPTFGISGPGTVCRNDVNTLSGNQSAYQYSWKMSYTYTGVPIYTAQATSIVVSPSVTAYYWVTATDSVTGCTLEKLHIMSVNACMGEDERNAKSQSVNIYPNPFSDYLNIQSNYKNLHITMFDATGNQVCSVTANDENYQIDIRHLPPGIYFVHVENEKIKVVQKVMKRE